MAYHSRNLAAVPDGRDVVVGFPVMYWAAVQFGMNAEALFREVSSAADARGAEAHDRFGFPNLSVNLRRTWAGGLSKPQTDHATSCSGERTSVIAQGLRIALAATHTSHEPRALDRLTIRWETRGQSLAQGSLRLPRPDRQAALNRHQSRD